MQNHSKSIVEHLANRPQVKASVVLGLVSKKCKGRGICAIVLDPPLDKFQECNKTNAIISLNEQGALTFSFTKASCKACTIEKYFNKHTFGVEETFEVPSAVAQSLNLDYFLIKTGEYSIQENKESYQVIFPA